MVYRTARKIAVAAVGGTVVLIGVIMIVTPGPACVVIPAGLAILATEFVWAKHLLAKARQHAVATARRVGFSGPRGSDAVPPPAAPPPPGSTAP